MWCTSVVLFVNFLCVVPVIVDGGRVSALSNLKNPATELGEYLGRRLTGGINTLTLPSITQRYGVVVGSVNLFFPRLDTEGRVNATAEVVSNDGKQLTARIDLVFPKILVQSLFVSRFAVVFSVGNFEAASSMNVINGDIVVRKDCSVEVKRLEVPTLQLKPNIFSCKLCKWLYGSRSLNKLMTKLSTEATKKLQASLFTYLSNIKIYSILNCPPQP